MKANQNILILLAVLLLVGGGAALKLASSPDEGPPDESPLFPDSFEAKKSAGGGFLEDKSLYAASEERIPVLPAVKRLEICRPIIFPEAVSFRGGSWSAQP